MESARRFSQYFNFGFSSAPLPDGGSSVYRVWADEYDVKFEPVNLWRTKMRENPEINLPAIVAEGRADHLKGQMEEIKYAVRTRLNSIDRQKDSIAEHQNEIDRLQAQIAKLEAGDWSPLTDSE